MDIVEGVLWMNGTFLNMTCFHLSFGFLVFVECLRAVRLLGCALLGVGPWDSGCLDVWCVRLGWTFSWYVYYCYLMHFLLSSLPFLFLHPAKRWPFQCSAYKMLHCVNINQ